MPTLIAALADTHVDDRLSTLPLSLLDLLYGLRPHFILHAGDITSERALDQLREIAPIVAVRGDHDQIRGLRPVEWINVEGWRIVVIHGDRPYYVCSKEFLSSWVNRLLVIVRVPFRWWNGFFKDIISKLTSSVPDLVVYGHLHQPNDQCVRGIRMICPGAVCVNSRLAHSSPPASIAKLTVDSHVVNVEFITLVSQQADTSVVGAIMPAHRRVYGYGSS